MGPYCFIIITIIIAALVPTCCMHEGVRLLEAYIILQWLGRNFKQRNANFRGRITLQIFQINGRLILVRNYGNLQV